MKVYLVYVYDTFYDGTVDKVFDNKEAALKHAKTLVPEGQSGEGLVVERELEHE
jgi:hypothetical protein